jgi:hypothetical protein
MVLRLHSKLVTFSASLLEGFDDIGLNLQHELHHRLRKSGLPGPHNVNLPIHPSYISAEVEIMRNPFIAGFLSLLIPGLGQIYNGRILFGLARCLCSVFPDRIGRLFRSDCSRHFRLVRTRTQRTIRSESKSLLLWHRLQSVIPRVETHRLRPAIIA